MFERFTRRAKEVVLLAAREAKRLGRPQVCTSDILLAMIREGRGVALVALALVNLDLRSVVQAAERAPDSPDDLPGQEGRYTEAVLRMCDQAIEEADSLGDGAVGTEHLLLAMLHDPACQSTRILTSLGLRADVVRTVLTSLLHSAGEPGTGADLPGFSDPEQEPPSQLSVQLSSHAGQVDALADEEAHRLNHDWVATEHLLFALLRDSDGNAARQLRRYGIDLPKARKAAMQLLPVGSRPSPAGRLPLTIGAQQVLHHAVQQARTIEKDVLYVATEHLLLGLLSEPRSLAGEVLRRLGVDLDEFRQALQALIDTGAMPPEDEAMSA